jgi:hypothetical protein
MNALGSLLLGARQCRHIGTVARFLYPYAPGICGTLLHLRGRSGARLLPVSRPCEEQQEQPRWRERDGVGEVLRWLRTTRPPTPLRSCSGHILEALTGREFPGYLAGHVCNRIILGPACCASPAWPFPSHGRHILIISQPKISRCGEHLLDFTCYSPQLCGEVIALLKHSPLGGLS